MFEIFTTAFSATFLAILQVFFIIITAGVLVRVRIITSDHIKSLTAVTVNVLLPCLIFSKIISTFDPGSFHIWWILPLTALGQIVIGLLLGWLFFIREMPAKKNMLALTSLQNAGYLILPMGRALFHGEAFDKFALYCFLYILGMSPILCPMGEYLSTSAENEKISFKVLLTPPLVANVLALLVVFTHSERLIPGFLEKPAGAMADSIALLGQAAVPLANFILGAVLGSITLRLKPYVFDAIRVMSVKLFLVPLFTVIILYYINLHADYPILAKFLILQAAAAPATGIILQAKKYGGDIQKISNIMLLSYMMCIITMPFWMAVWRSLS
ncbi:MAG: AEC family transporter [Phycisphaerae bacterium]|nr:AEC family transporter [Phycisphaerae bacterium]